MNNLNHKYRLKSKKSELESQNSKIKELEFDISNKYEKKIKAMGDKIDELIMNEHELKQAKVNLAMQLKSEEATVKKLEGLLISVKTEYAEKMHEFEKHKQR